MSAQVVATTALEGSIITSATWEHDSVQLDVKRDGKILQQKSALVMVMVKQQQISLFFLILIISPLNTLPTWRARQVFILLQIDHSKTMQRTTHLEYWYRAQPGRVVALRACDYCKASLSLSECHSCGTHRPTPDQPSLFNIHNLESTITHSLSVMFLKINVECGKYSHDKYWQTRVSPGERMLFLYLYFFLILLHGFTRMAKLEHDKHNIYISQTNSVWLLCFTVVEFYSCLKRIRRKAMFFM